MRLYASGERLWECGLNALKWTASGLAMAVVGAGTAHATEASESNQSAAMAASQAAGQAGEPVAQTSTSHTIIVTARKRSEALQDVPLAVSAVSGDQLDRLDIQTAEDLTALAPNLYTSKTTVSFTAPQFYMRGVGRSNHNWNAENAVAVFVDDIYLQSLASAYLEGGDFERVEVLRGPQGTLYGRNATTGAIKFVPRRPDLDYTEGYVDAKYGSNNRFNLSGAVSVPLVEGKLGMRASGYYSRTDGYLTRVDEANQVIDENFAKQRHFGGRLAFLLQATDNLEFELSADYTEYDDGTNLVTPIVPADPTDFTQILSKRGTVDFDPVFGVNRVATQPLTGNGGATFESWGITFKASLETSIGTLKSITGYRTYDEFFLSQLGGRGVPSTIFGLELFSTVDSTNDYEQFSQELQFTGSIFDDRFEFVAGAFYFENDWQQLQYGSIIGVPAAFSPVVFPGAPRSFGGTWNDTDQKTVSYAVYFDASFEIVEDFSLVAGVRQSWDEKDVFYDARFEDDILRYPGFPVMPSRDYKKFTPRFGFNWDITPDVLIYATYAEGYKAGNLEGDRASDPVPASTFLDPEVVENYEAGIKAELLGGRLTANLSAFTSKYTNKADLVSPQTVAIADVDIDGIEVELAARPVDGFNIFVNAGFLDASYRNADPGHPIFNPDPTGFAPGLNADPVVSPSYSITAGANYTYIFNNGSEIFLGVNLQAVDEHYNGLGVENYDSEIVEAYEVVDLILQYRLAQPGITFSLGVNNLFDSTYYTTGFFGAVPEVAGRYYADGRNFYLGTRFEF
ncbi:TonB-dependent receptor [Qipengyuania sp.]|uniref:TonB-dependent receptor n=1 Tax=Qipengyuania sp. TaxID=2004515 RepID=UPI003BA856F5